jgi:GTP-binding protein EngB required for normal cell division
MKLIISFPVAQTFEVDADMSGKVVALKQHIMEVKLYPLWSQRLIFSGNELQDMTNLSEVNLKENSIIHLIIKNSFLSKTHPIEYLDPITGQLLQEPVRASDGGVYSKSSLVAWKESFTGGAILSPITNRNSKLTFSDDDNMRARVNAYIAQLGSSDDDISNIDELGAVFTIIDHIRDDLAEVLCDWKVPQVVVVGNESIGKSTLLERLAMMPLFPRGEKRCTRMKVEIRLRRGEDQNPVLKLYSYGKDAPETSIEVSMESGCESLQQEMNKLISNPDMPQICPDKYLVMEITNRRAPNIDLVDMPGLIATPEAEATVISKMITDHHEQNGEFSMSLFMIEATRNVNQSPIGLIIERPDMQMNTLGVVTHMDRVDHTGSNTFRLDKLKSLAYGEECPEIGGVSLRPHGFVLTMLATQEGDAENGFEPIYQKAQREEPFFRDIGCADLVQDLRAGCRALIERLKAMYWDYLKRQWLPKTFTKIEHEINNWSTVDSNLGLPRAHVSLEGDAHDELVASVVSGTQKIFFESRLDVEANYEATFLPQFYSKLREELNNASMTRIEVQDYLGSVLTTIKKIGKSFLAEDMKFWMNMMRGILEKDDSPLKLARFDQLIASYSRLMKEKLRAANNITLNKLHKFLSFHLIDLASVEFDTDSGANLVTVKLPHALAGTILHMLSSNIHIFDATMLDENFIRAALKDSELIESCRTERVDALHKLEMLHIAKGEMEELAQIQGDENISLNAENV